MHLNKAFSLIEIMIVLGLIGALSLIAVPSYKIYLARAKVLSAYQLLEKLKPQIVEYYQDNGVFPGTLDLIGYSVSSSSGGNYSLSNDLNNSVITGIGMYSGGCGGAGITYPCVWVYINGTITGTAYNPDLVIGVNIQSNERVDYTCSTETSGITMPSTYIPKGCMICTGVNTGCVTY